VIDEKRIAEIRKAAMITGDLALRATFDETLELVECYEAARAYFAEPGINSDAFKAGRDKLIAIFPEKPNG